MRTRPLAARGALGARAMSTSFSARTSRSVQPVRVREARDRVRVELARERGGAEQAEAEARALLVGPVDQRRAGLRGDESLGVRPQDSDGRHDAERAVEPASVGHGVDVRADRQRRPARRRRRGAPTGCRPRRARSTLRSRPGARRGTRAPRARSRSRRRAGRRPRPEVRRWSSRRSAITRSASIRRGSVKPRGRAGWPAPGNALRRRRA